MVRRRWPRPGRRPPAFRPPARRPATIKAAPKAGPRPDLRSLPAWGISLSEEDGKWYVNFGATVWNAGTSPLLVDGFRRTGTELMDAYQYFYDDAGRQVGGLEHLVEVGGRQRVAL